MEEPAPYACSEQDEDPAQSMYPKILAHVNARLAGEEKNMGFSGSKCRLA